MDMPDRGEMRLESLNGPPNAGARHPGRSADALLRSASQLYRIETVTQDSGALGIK